MKATCIPAMAVALSVCLYIQSVMPKPVILEARTEMICPSQTMVNPNMPDGRLLVPVVVDVCMERFYLFTSKFYKL